MPGIDEIDESIKNAEALVQALIKENETLNVFNVNKWSFDGKPGFTEISRFVRLGSAQSAIDKLNTVIAELKEAKKKYDKIEIEPDPKSLEKILTVCTEKATACQKACAEALEQSQQFTYHLNSMKSYSETTIEACKKDPTYFASSTIPDNETRITYLASPINTAEEVTAAAKKAAESLTSSGLCITEDSRNSTEIDRTLAQVQSAESVLQKAISSRKEVMENSSYKSKDRAIDFDRERNALNGLLSSNKSLLSVLPQETEAHKAIIKRCTDLEKFIKEFPDNNTLENISAHMTDNSETKAANSKNRQALFNATDFLLSEQKAVNGKVATHQATVKAENSGPWQRYLSTLSSPFKVIWDKICAVGSLKEGIEEGARKDRSVGFRDLKIKDAINKLDKFVNDNKDKLNSSKEELNGARKLSSIAKKILETDDPAKKHELFTRFSELLKIIDDNAEISNGLKTLAKELGKSFHMDKDVNAAPTHKLSLKR